MQAWLLGSALLLLAGCSTSSFDPPERSGPIGLVDTGNGKQAWLATTQEEEISRRVGSGASRSASGRWITEYRYHLRLQAHDPATAQRLWLKELKVLRDKEGGRNAAIRILGQQGGIVWVWVDDQVLALSARDGNTMADGASIVQANPDIADALPNELKFHTFVGELVITLADARRVRIAVPGFKATPYQAPDEQQFSQAVSLGTTWNGGHNTADFGVRHGLLDGQWIGLLSQGEARDAENDQWGNNYADSAEIDSERDMARRTFWRASTSHTDEFLRWGGAKGGVRGYCEDQVSTLENREDGELLARSNDIEEYARNRGADPAKHRERMRACIEGFDEDKFKRIDKLEQVAGAGEWLQGYLLKAEATPGAPQWVQRGIVMKPAVRPPLQLKNPDGVLVLHRTRMDAQGRLALSRVDRTFNRTSWTATLPFTDLTNRWEVGEQLLLYGNWSVEKAGVTTRHQALVSLDLDSGRWTGWDVGADAQLEPQEAR